MAYRVQVTDSGQSFEVGAEETVLAAALRANIHLSHDCQLGGCGTCRIQLLEGRVAYAELPFALTPEEESAGYALACQAQPQSDLVISAARAQIELPVPVRCSAIVESVKSLSPLVAGLGLQIPDRESLHYLPGQYTNIILPDGSTRSFSMASKPRGNRVDFHIRHIAGGEFTGNHLARLRAGDRLDVELPLGSFHFRPQDYRPLLMVATGTGLAPVKAILESLMDDPDCPPASLYWGTRTASDLYLQEHIGHWRERLCEFNYVPVLSRADENWSGCKGYVQDAVLADLDDLSEYAIYLCGSPKMIASAKQAFLGRGANLDYVYTEGFTVQQKQPVAA